MTIQSRCKLSLFVLIGCMVTIFAQDSVSNSPALEVIPVSDSVSILPITHVLVYTTVIFLIGLIGVSYNRRNVIAILMSLELMFLSVNFNFIAFSGVHHAIDGQIFVFYSLAVAAVESAIGLAIFVLLYRQHQSIDVDSLSTLKG